VVTLANDLAGFWQWLAANQILRTLKPPYGVRQEEQLRLPFWDSLGVAGSLVPARQPWPISRPMPK
jgi:hypothetical protein